MVELETVYYKDFDKVADVIKKTVDSHRSETFAVGFQIIKLSENRYQLKGMIYNIKEAKKVKKLHDSFRKDKKG